MDRRGFSLASLLLLTAVVAVFLAAICTAWLPRDGGQQGSYAEQREKLDAGLVVACVIGGVIVGTVVGFVVGLRQARRLHGLAVGTFTGLITGAAGGLLLAVPGKILPIAVGSLVIVLYAVIVRRYSGDPPQ